jgi:hypothetical protein
MKRYPAAVILAAGLAALAWAQVNPPRPAPVSHAWQLDIQVEDLLPIQVQVAGETSPRVYWYLRYTVTNRTGADRVFVPQFDLYTDTGQLLRASQGVPSAVFHQIKQLHNDPLLEPMAGMAGKILQGADNAKSGVAIWRDFDPRAGAFDVFAGGLSGETIRVPLPVPITQTQTDPLGETTQVTRDALILSKSLQLHYRVPGEAQARSQHKAILDGRDWVMR